MPTADILTVKLLLNSVVSTPGAKFFTMDISNFYLNTPLKRKEYVRMKLGDFHKSVVKQLGLCRCVQRNVQAPAGGNSGAKVAGKRLNAAGYHPSQYTPGLWTHEWRPICFTVVVDYFGVKYVGEDHAQHLLDVVKQYYKVTDDLSTETQSDKVIDITLEWDYEKRRVHLSMPGYVPEALIRF